MAGENAILTLVTDIREGMKEVKIDVKELRTEVHTLSIKFAEMGDTHSKIDNVEGQVEALVKTVTEMDGRLREAETKLAVTEDRAAALPELQKDYWQKTGKIAGIGAAILALISLGGLLAKLLG